MLIIRANVWRLIDALTEANYSFSKACCIHFTMLWIESFWVKSSNWSKLTKHRTTVWSEAVVGKSVRSGKLCVNVICPNVWRHTHTHTKVSASVRGLTELDSKLFLCIETCIEQTAPSTFTNHFESKRTCWTIYQIVNFSNIMFRV